MLYPEEIIEEIRSRNDIFDVISGYVKLQKKGSSYFGLCPFHNEKSGSFSVAPHKQMYHCFGCGAGGNVITFIMEYENFTFVEAVKLLADRAGITLPDAEYSEENRRAFDLKSRLFEINKLAATYFYHQLQVENGKKAKDYLSNRELSEETINQFGLGYANIISDDLYKYFKGKGYQDDILKETGLFSYENSYKSGVNDKFWNRIMFPIMDVNNKVVGFGGRVMGDAKPKYLNSPETKLFDKSRNLYGLNIARISRKPNLIICEGYMDVISLHQAGFNQAVASLGTALTLGQASLMKRYTNEVLITYDSDEAGVKAAIRSIPILKAAGLTTRVIDMRPYKDPDEFIKALGAEAFQERIDKAMNSFMYEISTMQLEYDLKDPESKTKFFNEISKRIVEFSEELERNNYIEAVADNYMISADSLRKMVANYGSRVGLIKPISEPRKSNLKKDKEDGVKKAQKILLTWMINDVPLFQKITQYISPEDFIEPLFNDVANKLYQQLESGNVNPASIISTYESEEEQKEVAALFNSELSDELNDNEMEKALNETILKVKKNSLEYKSRNVKNMEELKNIANEKKLLQNIHVEL